MTTGFNCQRDTTRDQWEEILSEGLSVLGWPVSISVGIILIDLGRPSPLGAEPFCLGRVPEPRKRGETELGMNIHT